MLKSIGEITQYDIASSYFKGDIKSVSEMSLLSMWSRSISGPNEASFGIITSWNYHLSLEENIQILDEFTRILKSWRLSFYRLYAYWQTTEGMNIDGNGHGILEKRNDIYRELLLFIPWISMQQLALVGEEFNQDGWIYSGPQSSGKVIIILRDGYERTFNNFSIESITIAYTSIRNFNYNFIGFRMPPQGFMDGIQYMYAEKEYKQAILKKIRNDTGRTSLRQVVNS